MTGVIRLASALLAGGGLLLAGGSASAAGTANPAGHGTPVIEAAPAHAPKMTQANGSCTLPTTSNASPRGSGKDLLWVRSQPTGVIAIWISGLNAKHCVARRTSDGAAVAQRIARAIRHTKAFPTEPLPCPFDDNTAVRLYFSYPTGSDEYAAVSLDGCRPISAPGRASRWSDAAVEKALRPAAPAAWSTYLAT